MQELDNPFEGKSKEDSLTMTYRYGYYDLDGKPTLQEYILLEAKGSPKNCRTNGWSCI